MFMYVHVCTIQTVLEKQTMSVDTIEQMLLPNILMNIQFKLYIAAACKFTIGKAQPYGKSNFTRPYILYEIQGKDLQLKKKIPKRAPHGITVTLH